MIDIACISFSDDFPKNTAFLEELRLQCCGDYVCLI